MVARITVVAASEADSEAAVELGGASQLPHRPQRQLCHPAHKPAAVAVRVAVAVGRRCQRLSIALNNGVAHRQEAQIGVGAGGDGSNDAALIDGDAEGGRGALASGDGQLRYSVPGASAASRLRSRFTRSMREHLLSRSRPWPFPASSPRNRSGRCRVRWRSIDVTRASGGSGLDGTRRHHLGAPRRAVHALARRRRRLGVLAARADVVEQLDVGHERPIAERVGRRRAARAAPADSQHRRPPAGRRTIPRSRGGRRRRRRDRRAGVEPNMRCRGFGRRRRRARARRRLLPSLEEKSRSRIPEASSPSFAALSPVLPPSQPRNSRGLQPRPTMSSGRFRRRVAARRRGHLAPPRRRPAPVPPRSSCPSRTPSASQRNDAAATAAPQRAIVKALHPGGLAHPGGRRATESRSTVEIGGSLRAAALLRGRRASSRWCGGRRRRRRGLSAELVGHRRRALSFGAAPGPAPAAAAASTAAAATTATTRRRTSWSS